MALDEAAHLTASTSKRQKSSFSLKQHPQSSTHSESTTFAKQVGQSSGTFSVKLCSRCFKLQEYVTRKSYFEFNDFETREFKSDAFRPSSLDREACGVCRVIYQAAEKIAMNRLDELWEVSLDRRYRPFKTREGLNNSDQREDFNFTLEIPKRPTTKGELKVLIFSSPGKLFLDHVYHHKFLDSNLVTRSTMSVVDISTVISVVVVALSI